MDQTLRSNRPVAGTYGLTRRLTPWASMIRPRPEPAAKPRPRIGALWTFLCALVVVVTLWPAQVAAASGSHRVQDDEIVKEFKKYFRKYKDTPTRVSAVLDLEGAEDPEVVKVLLPVLGGDEPDVTRAAVRVLSTFKGQRPIAALFEALESQKKEGVRVGLLRAIAAGGYAGATTPILTCLEDKSWEVRRRALMALATTGDPTVAEYVLPLCEEKETAVRCAAIDALAELRAEEVVDVALANLEHETWQVRASAIQALAVVRRKRAIGPLIPRLGLEEGRLAVDVANALRDLTGRNFGQRQELWERFWANNSERFEPLTDAQLAKLREDQAKSREKYSPTGGTSFHGVETPSKSIIFVIDVSGSMENLVIEKERFQDGDYPSYQRIDIVKTELKRTIENLEDYVEFNILAFATEVRSWKKSQVRAGTLNKSSAISFVNKLEALGGNSKEDLASVGLTGSANLEAGKTNTFAALMDALGRAGTAIRDKHYEVAVDTIFFLSDGRPSHGTYVDTDDILREVREANSLRKVVLHTIALGEFQKDFMRRLATENGGVFVDLGR